MGFSSGSMNIVIKNNRDLLKNHRKSLKEISKLSSSKTNQKEVKYTFPKVCSKTVELIGERTKISNKELFVKQLVVFGIIMSIILSVFLYFF